MISFAMRYINIINLGPKKKFTFKKRPPSRTPEKTFTAVTFRQRYCLLSCLSLSLSFFISLSFFLLVFFFHFLVWRLKISQKGFPKNDPSHLIPTQFASTICYKKGVNRRSNHQSGSSLHFEGNSN